MSVWYWSRLQPLNDPVFLVTEFVFVLLMALVGYRAGTSRSWGLQMGILFGYLYGVVVWGTITYRYQFRGITKLLLAGSIVVDGVILVLLFQYIFRRIETHRDALAEAAFHARRKGQGAA